MTDVIAAWIENRKVLPDAEVNSDFKLDQLIKDLRLDSIELARRQLEQMHHEASMDMRYATDVRKMHAAYDVKRKAERALRRLGKDTDEYGVILDDI